MRGRKSIDEIWLSYQVALDSLRIATRSIDRNHIELLKNTNFLGSTIPEARTLIDDSRSNANEYVILSMWAVFERKLFHWLHSESQKILDLNPSEFNTQVHQKIESDLEFWRIDEILDIFKSVVNPDLIGQAKQIKKYRDWVAHRNPKKPPPTNVLPITAYKVLSEILNELDQHPDLLKAPANHSE